MDQNCRKKFSNLHIIDERGCFFRICVALILNGCASSSVYRFQSQPSDAAVYYIHGQDKTLLGQTPIDYTKTQLPSDAPFTIYFEKQGYDVKEIAVTPTDNSQTTISATMKQSKEPMSDPVNKRVRKSIQKIFQIQELTARHRYVDALSEIKTLEEQEPGVVEISILKGSIYLILNDPTQAKDAWDKALAADPSLDDLRARIKALKLPEKGVVK